MEIPETRIFSTFPACQSAEACRTRTASIGLIFPFGFTNAPGTIATCARGTSTASPVDSPLGASQST